MITFIPPFLPLQLPQTSSQYITIPTSYLTLFLLRNSLNLINATHMCLGVRPSTRPREGHLPTITPPNMNDSHKSVAPELTLPETLIEMRTFSSPILELLDHN